MRFKIREETNPGGGLSTSHLRLPSISGNTYRDLNAIIGKDQSGVRAGELGGGHFVDWG
jgi:hypothetical protein